MNYREYEKYQLELIAMEYHSRGFKVRIETGVQGFQYRFDAVAEGPSGEQIFIEIVNKNQTIEAAQRRLLALEEVVARAPNAKVDFRYIDVDTIGFRMASNRQGSVQPELKQLLAMRVPSLPQTTVTGQFLKLWQLHASTIRAFAISLGMGEEPNLTVLDLYNETLRQNFIQPPEDIVEEVEMDLFDIFDNVQSAIQGGVVGQHLFDQLRFHVLEVRREIRQKLTQRSAVRDAKI